MPLDTKLRQVGTILAIPAVLLAIGAGYERGGVSGLRNLADDVLHSVGLASKAPAHAAAPLLAPAAKTPAAGLAPDQAFWLTIKDARAPGLFEEFLKKFPGSAHAPDARARLMQLQQLHPAATHTASMPMRHHGPGMMSPQD